MDFMRLLKSLEELLYELASWLVFYPMTMWRALRHPQAMMRYADMELADDAASQYAETLSPPLFLLITLLIAHGLEMSMLRQATQAALPPLLANDSNLLIFRAVTFSIFPLLMAVKLLRHRKIPLDRNTLRPPFYSQCYVAAPFAFALSVAFLLLRVENPVTVVAGLATFVVALLWYLVVETRWFMADLKLSSSRAALLVIVTMCEALVIMFLAGAFVAYGLNSR